MWAWELACELPRELVCLLVRWICVWELACVWVGVGVGVGGDGGRWCGCWQVGVGVDVSVGAVGCVGVSVGVLMSCLHLV